MNRRSLIQSRFSVFIFSVVWMMNIIHALISIKQAHALTDSFEIHQTQVRAIAARQKTQKTEERWATVKGELKAHYQTLKSEKKILEEEKAVIERQIAVMKNRQTQAERMLTETALIRKRLHSLLVRIIARLEDNIASDLPFLMQERTERIGRLKDTMLQPEASMAEKCRLVMEALKIETEYGQTVEVYQEAIQADGQTNDQPVVADILRLGRLAIYWQTPDGKTVGHWERFGGNWSVLPDKYRRPINDAMEMALKRRTIEMVKLPLGRIAAQ